MPRRWIDRIVRSVRARLDVPPERDMDAEMRFHLEMATRRNVERGMTPADARRRALAQFGGIAQQREAAREAVPGRWLEVVRQDLGYALRSLRRNPGFATSVVLTLALGIGANTAIFSVVNGVLLRPLPVRDPDKIVFIGWSFGKGDGLGALSSLELDFLRRHAKAFDGIATYRTFERDLGEPPNAHPVHGLRVGEEFFKAVGIGPATGRGFSADEEKPGGPAVAVLSDAIWRREFAADRGIIGKSIVLDGTPYTVVGVAAPELRVPGLSRQEADVIVPLQLVVDPTEKGNNYEVLARVRLDRSREQVAADLAAVSDAFRADHPELVAATERYAMFAFKDLYVGPLERTLLILLGAVTFVLLIATANAANLLLARATAREREIVVRTALGATRSRIVRQLLSEGIVLSLVSGIAGLVLGMWGVRVLLALMPHQLPRADEIGVDVRVLAFTAGIVVLTGLAFGLAAAGPTERLNLTSALGERARGPGGSQRSRDLLVMSETAFAIVLLAGAGLLLSSFAKLRGVNPGFTAEGVTAVRFGRMPRGFETIDAIWRFERQMIERLSSVPVVQSVAALPNFPLERGWNMPVAIAGVAESGDGGVEYRWVSPAYFETLRIPIMQGRGFSPDDERTAPRVAIVNESMARRFFPDGNVLGRQLDVGRYRDQWVGEEFKGTVEIVGIAGDIREVQLGKPPRRTVYVPIAQVQDRVADSPLLAIRASPGAPLQKAVVDAARSIDPRVPTPQLQPMPTIVGASIAEQRFQTMLLTLFAGTALALTAIGIFGVVSYGVQQRVREIGVRVALGASSGAVLRLIVGRSLRYVVAGAVIGLLGALGLTRFLSSFLYEVKATDPVSFSLAVATLIGVALVASYLPARRATRVDPVRALRLE